MGGERIGTLIICSDDTGAPRKRRRSATRRGSEGDFLRVKVSPSNVTSRKDRIMRFDLEEFMK